MKRRDLLRAASIYAGALVAAPFINRNRYRLFAATRQEYSARAIRLVRETLVIDMLGLLTLNRNLAAQWAADAESFSEEYFQELLSCGINVFHDARPGPHSVPGTSTLEAALLFFADQNALIAGNAHRLMRVDSAADLNMVHGSGKVGVLLGVQNSAHFRTPDDVNLFHDLGQRVSQLTYNNRNLIGTGSTERNDGGISDFGVSIIERMSQVGMAVDVSHCGEQTTLEAFEISRKPVLITHSNVRKLAGGNPRTKTDEAILAVKKAGSVIGITGVRNFVKASEPTTIEDLLDHYDYVKNLIGPEHLGIGSDIDLNGYDDTPPEQQKALRAAYKSSYGFRDKLDIDEVAQPKRVYDLTEGLIRRKYSDAQIMGILGENFRRVLSEVWDVPPLEPKKAPA